MHLLAMLALLAAPVEGAAHSKSKPAVPPRSATELPVDQAALRGAVEWQLRLTGQKGEETRYPWTSDPDGIDFEGWICVVEAWVPTKLERNWKLAVQCARSGDTQHVLGTVVAECGLKGSEAEVVHADPLAFVYGDKEAKALVTHAVLGADCRINKDPEASRRFYEAAEQLSKASKAQ